MHPYTKALLSAIPVPDPDFEMERIPLKGELTSPINPEPDAGLQSAVLMQRKAVPANEMTSKGNGAGALGSCRMVQEQG